MKTKPKCIQYLEISKAYAAKTGYRRLYDYFNKTQPYSWWDGDKKLFAGTFIECIDYAKEKLEMLND